jgi:hypothetical protein
MPWFCCHFKSLSLYHILNSFSETLFFGLGFGKFPSGFYIILAFPTISLLSPRLPPQCCLQCPCLWWLLLLWRNGRCGSLGLWWEVVQMGIASTGKWIVMSGKTGAARNPLPKVAWGHFIGNLHWTAPQGWRQGWRINTKPPTLSLCDVQSSDSMIMRFLHGAQAAPRLIWASLLTSCQETYSWAQPGQLCHTS